jgi:hypothetical protein
MPDPKKNFGLVNVFPIGAVSVASMIVDLAANHRKTCEGRVRPSSRSQRYVSIAMSADHKPFFLRPYLFTQYLRPTSLLMVFVVGISVICFAIMMFSNSNKLGIYPDAVNNDYIAVRILHPSRQSFVVVLPGNLIFNWLPVLAGGIYYGSFPAYWAAPFIVFGSSVATFVFSHFVLGVSLLFVVFFFVSWAARPSPIAVCAVALMGLDPAYIFTWRTQAYITAFPAAFVLLALWLILKADDREDRRRLYALSGGLMGVAFWGYFIHIFFAPGIVLSIGWRNRLRPRQAAILIVFFFLGLCCGAMFYFIGYTLYFKQLGLWGGIEWMRRALNDMPQLNAAGAEASLPDRLVYSFSMLRMALTSEFHDAMIFGGGGGSLLQDVKMAVLILVSLIGIPFALGDDRASRAFRLVGASILSFLAVSLLFGRGLSGHHFCTLIPLFYAAFALGGAGIARAARPSWKTYANTAAAAVGAVLLFANLSVYGQFSRRLSQDQAANLYSPVVNDYPLLAKDQFRNYTHAFMSWGIALPFVYLTDGNVAAVEALTPAFDPGLRAAVCSGKPYKLVFAGNHGVEDAQNTLNRLQFKADIQNYAPPGLSFQYVVATLATPERSSCP